MSTPDVTAFDFNTAFWLQHIVNRWRRDPDRPAIVGRLGYESATAAATVFPSLERPRGLANAVLNLEKASLVARERWSGSVWALIPTEAALALQEPLEAFLALHELEENA